MKKALVSILRLAMFVGVLVLLSFGGKGPEAQLAHQCETFYTEDGTCPNCCTITGGNFPNEIVTVSLPTGTQSILNTNYSCGTQLAGCPVACSGTYPQAVSDSGCCIASGSACANNEPCCPGLICRSSGNCGACSATGAVCENSLDCCQDGDICSGGKCATASAGPDCGCCKGIVGAKLLEPPQQKDVKLGKAQTSCNYDCACCQPACSPASPIMIDLTGTGFFLTDAAHGVLFDIKDTGKALQVAWTAPNAQNAFLALPGPDGLVHNGQQLFGNFAPQPPCPVGDTSCSPNGFRALAVYDDPANGGNGDGIIDLRDAIFSSLRLWIDANHDGISQPEELYMLPSLGINSISLNYKWDQRTDQYGNIFRYRAQVGSTSGAGRMAYDVFLVIQTSNAVTAQSCPGVPLPRLLPEGNDGRLH